MKLLPKLGVGVGKCWGKGKVQKNATNFCLNFSLFFLVSIYDNEYQAQKN